MHNVDCDVLVIGGGGSGLAAAIEARSLGRKVILLERNETLGGSTARSVGSITASNTPHQAKKGILDSPEHHFEDLAKFNARVPLPDSTELSRLLVTNVPDTFRWLVSMGVEFFGPLPEPPHRKPRMHNVLPNSRAYIYHLARQAKRLGVEIRLRSRVLGILREGDEIIGARCEGPDGVTELRARGGVILATGDFAGNPEMLSRYVSPASATIEPINPTNTGDGHRMVLDLGGRLIHPELHLAGIRFQPPPPKWITSLPPWRIVTRLMNLAMEHLPQKILRPFVMSFLTTILVPEAKLYSAGALLVNREGKRFAEETRDPATLLSKQPEKYAYILLDKKLAEQFSQWPNFISTAPGVAYAYVDDYRRTRKDIFHEAQTLEALAIQLMMPPGALEASIADYNSSVGPSKVKFEDGPYIALGPVRHYIQFTDAGIAVDTQLRVLGPNDHPIPGLYAVGFVGMGGTLLKGHGHHLGWAFTSGRLAGRYAAHRAVSSDLAFS